MDLPRFANRPCDADSGAEFFAETAAAIRAELTAKELGNTIHCHPTYSEFWMEATHALHGTCIHAAPKWRKQAAGHRN